MPCPRCGRDLPPHASECPVCGPAAADTTGVFAPPGPGDQTFLGPPAAEPTGVVDTEGTRLSNAPPVGAGLSPDATRLPPAAARPAGSRRQTSATLTVGEPFGTRYHILKVLGEGGMGAVYQAWDEELGVAVALKVIRPDALSSPAEADELERRFKRELLLARKVTHRHVVRIHDLGDVDGVKYITMTFVDGEDLSTALRREGRLPVPRVLRIARQVASGLAAAHEAGVVHRDLKPANIMIDADDEALIMDFGIALSSGREARGPAKAASAAAPAAAPSAATVEDGATMLPAAGTDGATMLPPAGGVTMMPPTPPPGSMRAGRSGTMMSSHVGAIVGTLEYMAPEQSRGEPVDQRADIYAFGLILSDLLTGARKPTPGTTPWETLTARVTTAPAPLRTRHAEIPEALDAVVTRCVQIDAAERYQTTADVVAALARLDDDGNPIPEPKVRRLTARMGIAAGLLVAALLGGTYWLASGPAAPPPVPDPVSVLIADFANRTNDPVFDGLLEQAMAFGVETASFVSAYPRHDAQRLAGQLKQGGTLDEPTATLVALREGVNRVVAGSIALDGGEYQLGLRLLNPNAQDEKARVLMAWDTKAANRDAVLGAVGRMAARVREALGDATAQSDAVTDEESFTAASLEAARAYSTAQELQWAGRYDGAYEQYQRAVALDPNMGRAFAGLGASASSLGRRDEAEAYYKQALAKLGRMTEREKFRTRGGYYLLTLNSAKAREEFQALVKQYPADSAGIINLALVEFYRRDMARAVELGRQASALLPKNVLFKNNTALFAMYAGNFDLAQKEAAGVLEINPEFPKAYVAIGLSQLASDKPAEAEAAYRRLAPLPGSASWFAASGLADVAMYQGRLTDAAALLEAAVKTEKNASRLARLTVTLAEVRLVQGNRRDAVRLANTALSGTANATVTYLAGSVLASAGQGSAAMALVRKLLERFDLESLGLARVLEGEVALAAGEARKAVEKFTEARSFADSWLGRFGLGRAYLAAGATTEAAAEFDRCVQRRGEATAALLDDVPTYRFAAALSYYQGRVHEALGSADAPGHYQTFLDIKQGGDEQGLVKDARARLAALAR